ncbi:unnamed protein product [Trichobilharzia regenti]|nr:unnamed protein product [Trichobilharzia regenti]
MGSVLSRITASRKDEANTTTTPDTRPAGIRKRWSWRSNKKPADITVNAATTVNRSSTLPARPRLQVHEGDTETRRHDDIFDEEPQQQQQQQQPKVDSNSTTVKQSSQSEAISQQPNEQINVECINKSLVQEVPEVKDVKEQNESESKDELKTSISIEEADLLMTRVLSEEENEIIKEEDKVELKTDGGVLAHPDSNVEFVENFKNDEEHDKDAEHAIHDTGVIQPQEEINKSQEELNDIIEHSLKQEGLQLDENEVVHEIIEEELKPVEQNSVTAIPFEGEEEFLEEEIRKHENAEEQKVVDNEIVEHSVDHPIIPENIQLNESIQSQVDECYSNSGLVYTPLPDQLITSSDTNLNDLNDTTDVTGEQHNVLHQMMEHSNLVESLNNKSNSPANLSSDEIFLITEPIEKHTDIELTENENSLSAIHQAEQSVSPHEPGDVIPTESVEEIYTKEAEKILDDISTTERTTQEDEIQETVQNESVTSWLPNQSVPPHHEPTIDIKSTESTEELYTKQSEDNLDNTSTENILDKDVLQEVVQDESAKNWLPNECVSHTPLDAKYAEVIEEMYIGHAENIIDEVFTKNIESDIVHQKIASDPLPTEVEDEIFIKEDMPSESIAAKEVLQEGVQSGESTEQSVPVDIVPTEANEEMYTKQVENTFDDVPSENIADKDVLQEGVENESVNWSTEQSVPVDVIPTESTEEMYTKQAENTFDDVPSENIADKDVLQEGVENESVNWSTEQSVPVDVIPTESIEEMYRKQAENIWGDISTDEVQNDSMTNWLPNQSVSPHEPKDVKSMQSSEELYPEQADEILHDIPVENITTTLEDQLQEDVQSESLITENIDKDAVVQQEEMTSIQLPECLSNPGMHKEENTIEETLENIQHDNLMHQEFQQNEVIGEQIKEQIMSSDELQLEVQEKQSFPDTTLSEEKLEAKEDEVEIIANQMKVSLDNDIAEDMHNEEVVSTTEASEHLPESGMTTEESIDNLKSELESAYTTTTNPTYNTEIAGINHDLISSNNQHMNSTENLFIHDNDNKESNLPSVDVSHPTEIDDKNHVVEEEADSFIKSVLQNAQEHVWNENHINDQPQQYTTMPTIPTPTSLTTGSQHNSMNSLSDNNNNNNHGDDEEADGITTDENILKMKKLDLNQSNDLMEQDQSSIGNELHHNNLTNNSNGSHHIL